MTSWINATYTIVALIVVTLLMYVMQKVEYDRWSKTDAIWLQWLRRLAFVIAALILLYSTSATDWELASLLLVSASGTILAINALALHMRSLPGPGYRARQVSFRPSGLVARLVRYFSLHR